MFEVYGSFKMVIARISFGRLPNKFQSMTNSRYHMNSDSPFAWEPSSMSAIYTMTVSSKISEGGEVEAVDFWKPCLWSFIRDLIWQVVFLGEVDGVERYALCAYSWHNSDGRGNWWWRMWNSSSSTIFFKSFFNYSILKFSSLSCRNS